MIKGAVLGVCLALAATSPFAAPAPTTALWRTLPAPAPLPAATASGYVVHDGARLWWESFGAGRPLVLLHGGLSNSEVWGDQVPALVRAGYRVILIDSRGHGRSSRDERPYTYERMAADVVAVLDDRRIPRASILGWSDGAIIGLVMAMKTPERVDRVFAFAANMDPSGINSAPDADPTFAHFSTGAAADYRRLSPTPDDFAAFSGAVRRMWDTEPNYTAAELARIHTPVAIVDGDHDEAIKRDHTEYLARSIPGAKLIILPDVSHFAMLQNPVGFDDAVLGFLNGR